MPFDLKNSPAVFQHFIKDVLEDILNVFVFSYINDIIVFSSDLEIHLDHLTEVLQRLRRAGLYAKLKKMRISGSFLRLSCSPNSH